MEIIDIDDIKINRKRLDRRVMGKNRLSDKSKRLYGDMIDDCLENGMSLIKGRGIFSFFESGIGDSYVDLGGERFYSRFLVSRFGRLDGQELGLFIVTIGPGLNDISKSEMSSGNPHIGYIYDLIGSEFVESAADALQGILEKEKGSCMSRYSPGYNDWDISEQQKLFGLFPGEDKVEGRVIDGVDVLLTPSNIMLPEKSISAIVGHSDRRADGCEACKKKDCAYRE